ncbi:DUF934 domain-containing protein [Marinibactrum halimedae]|uniref:DUF934 domain-containing protein n=1 Tax=Marinibactrum halimedae TaxID=1444977 RepID=A0AA37WMH1_9GAMM|nr:DUF934 domain-containing protein [Marinibactrum halimedae]MCD9460584.1 DUF934 domain-containing protein [Marinibactrum halimedae]GLS27214.1 hypothetical protein GCM10007877_29330 [Marinibactrum halimedae]
MPKLIKDGAIADNTWQFIDTAEDANTPLPTAPLPTGNIIVPLAVWQAQKETLKGRRNEIGVWLNSTELADTLGSDAAELPLIALRFPVFMDGRGFSTARLLRERYGFTGELRACGYFIRDQLFYLKRCGFNAFDFGEQYDENELEKAMQSLNDFSDGYQTSVDQPVPLFRRRA